MSSQYSVSEVRIISRRQGWAKARLRRRAHAERLKVGTLRFAHLDWLHGIEPLAIDSSDVDHPDITTSIMPNRIQCDLSSLSLLGCGPLPASPESIPHWWFVLRLVERKLFDFYSRHFKLDAINLHMKFRADVNQLPFVDRQTRKFSKLDS